MINLISQEAKKRVEVQYFLRLGTVSLLIIAAFLFLGTVLLVPSYFVASEKENNERARAEDLRNNEAFQENKELSELVDVTKEQLRIIDRVPSVIVSDQLIQPLLDYVYADTSNIRLDVINFATTEDEFVIKISGTAPVRDDLLEFVEMLKKDTLFSKVEVPVSSFVQNSDIKFDATLYIARDEI